MHLFYQPQFEALSALTNDEAFHAAKVLRLREGERIGVTDGTGNWFEAIVQKTDPKQCLVRILQQTTITPRSYGIELVVAPTKNLDRIEWLVEKAVEMGINQFSFAYTNHSERRTIKLERLQKIAISAMKQSLQAYLPTLTEVGDLKNYLPRIKAQQRFVAHLPENSTPLHLFRAAQPRQTYAVLIGPEGDFAEQELTMALDSGFEMVTLGNTRLRTETAALVACQVLHTLNIEY